MDGYCTEPAGHHTPSNPRWLCGGMSNLALIISLLAVVTALAALAERIRISSPIIKVTVGEYQY